MTTNEILERLERWQEAVSRVEEVMDGLHKLLGAHPESPMFEAIYPLQGLATEQAAELIGCSADWLNMWWLEGSFGAKPMEIVLGGGERQTISTIEQLAAVIAADMERSA